MNEQEKILQLSLEKLTDQFNNFVGACMTESGTPKTPSGKDLSIARACLPVSCSNAFNYKIPVSAQHKLRQLMETALVNFVPHEAGKLTATYRMLEGVLLGVSHVIVTADAKGVDSLHDYFRLHIEDLAPHITVHRLHAYFNWHEVEQWTSTSDCIVLINPEIFLYQLKDYYNMMKSVAVFNARIRLTVNAELPSNVKSYLRLCFNANLDNCKI